MQKENIAIKCLKKIYRIIEIVYTLSFFLFLVYWCDSIRIFVEAVANTGQSMVQIHIMLRIYFSAISLEVFKRYFYYIRVH